MIEARMAACEHLAAESSGVQRFQKQTLSAQRLNQMNHSSQFRVVLSALSSAVAAFACGGTAHADIGGLLDDCYNGNIPTNTLCAERTANFNQAGFYGRALVKATYLPQREGSSSTPLRLDVTLELNDPANSFAPYGSVGVQVLPHTYSFHRERSYMSGPGSAVSLARDYGTKVLTGSFSFEITQNWGAEYLEYLDSLEVLLPGVADKIIIDL